MQHIRFTDYTMCSEKFLLKSMELQQLASHSVSNSHALLLRNINNEYWTGWDSSDVISTLNWLILNNPVPPIPLCRLSTTVQCVTPSLPLILFCHMQNTAYYISSYCRPITNVFCFPWHSIMSHFITSAWHQYLLCSLSAAFSEPALIS